jgi:chemotaxis protein MotA
MNISSLFGVILGATIFFLGLRATTPNIEFFLDSHAILLVIGGTAAAAFTSYPLTRVFYLFKIFTLIFLGKRKIDYHSTINQILELNKKAAGGLIGLKDSIAGIKNEFLREGVALVSNGVLSEKEIKATLDQRLRTLEIRYMNDAMMFKNIGRFPPAFGLLATTLGMIAVLQKIGQPDSQKLIGPAMSVGLVGTLYGIALANLVFLPIAESLTLRAKEEVALRKMIIEGVMLLKQQTNPVVMREALNSHLLPSDRVSKKMAA